MKQTTNSILMIRPVAFRMNEQTAVNNYYQKVLDGLLFYISITYACEALVFEWIIDSAINY